MIKNSLKQLIRSPGKVILFFLLICGCTVLIALGSAMCMRAARQIQAAEDEFSTVGWVSQEPVNIEKTLWDDPCWGMDCWVHNVYSKRLKLEDLMFDEAEYIRAPETRPIYVAYMPQLVDSGINNDQCREAVIEFRALEGRDDGGPVKSEITRILYQYSDGIRLGSIGVSDPLLNRYIVEVGDKLVVCQHYKNTYPYPLEAGKTYVGCIRWWPCGKHAPEGEGQLDEYLLVNGACTSQCDMDGNPMETCLFPAGVWYESEGKWFQEVTEDFYEPGHAGAAWENHARMKEEMADHVFPVLGANCLNLIKAYYDRVMIMDDGREITQDEFDSGAHVCMMTRDFADANDFKVGDKIKVPLMASLYGASLALNELIITDKFNLVNAQGELYDTFWEAEYEIVGTFRSIGGWKYDDLARDMLIIPERSVEASDEDNIALCNYLNWRTTSFQIPNGSIQKFDAALRAAVPEVEHLNIEYNDKGYTQVVRVLRKALNMGFLLLGAGLLAAIAVIVLLMYFFIVKEQRRTAVERSLGLSKRQCRVSLLSGIMIMTLVGTIIGSAAGYALMARTTAVLTEEGAGNETEDTDSTPEPEAITDAETGEDGGTNEDILSFDDYDTSYSLWAPPGLDESVPEVTVEPLPGWLYLLIPVLISGIVFALGMVFVGRNLRIEPIYLLSLKE